MSDATREKQTVQEEWKRRSRAEKEEDEDYKDFQGMDLCLPLTALWPHLTLSMSSDNSVLSWPRLPLMALVSLHLYFFCSSIQRSSEHFGLCCWPPTPQPTSTQQPVISLAETTEAFPSPFICNIFLVLDWQAGRPPICVPF